MLQQALTRTNYGDLSRDMKFPDWLTKLYTQGSAHWEDISGEGGDALGAWHALSSRGLLQPRDQDLNQFRTLRALQQQMRSANYAAELQRIRAAAQIAKMKQDAQDVVLVDNDRYWAAVPMNYGACYVFNNLGHISNFCTGGSSGAKWFDSYAPDGPMIMVVDKAHVNSADGKWQLHAPTRQIVNSDQDNRYNTASNDQRFATLFPGLMADIARSMLRHKAEIAAASKKTLGKSYDVTAAVNALRNTFPQSWASRATDTAADHPQDDQLANLPVSDSIARIRPDLRQWLAQDFENKISDTRTHARRMRIHQRGPGPGIVDILASSADQAIELLLSQHTIAPGSIWRIGRPPAGS
jgi:hypothetical protein